jgi:ABC-type uncharacterized transport system substrate-binding protein
MKISLKMVAFFAVCLILPAAGAPKNLIAIMPAKGVFMAALDGLKGQLDENYNVQVIDMGAAPKPEDVAAQCKSTNADAIILMDSKAVKLMRELQKIDTVIAALPKFVLMTLMVEPMTKGFTNVAGVKFEVPLYTLVVNFRIISEKDFSTVGIFHRRPFTAFVEESKKLLEREGIKLDGVCIDCDSKENATPEDALNFMKKNLDGMVKKDKADLIIIPADDKIFNGASMGDFWIDKVKKQKIPSLASIDMLASDKFAVAVFAADPDATQLGAQAANQIIDHFDNQTPLDKIGFEKTISVKSTLNMNVAKEIGWKLKEDKLGRITTIIGK